MRGERAPPATPLGSVIVAVKTLFVKADVFGSGVYEIAGGERSTAIPANSSAPISGVETFRALPSKSSVMPDTGMPPLSSCVGTAALICRLYGAEVEFMN